MDGSIVFAKIKIIIIDSYKYLILFVQFLEDAR